jgi:hypothetical protein
MITGAYDHAQVNQSLHTLMDSRARNAALSRHVLERDTGIL